MKFTITRINKQNKLMVSSNKQTKLLLDTDGRSGNVLNGNGLYTLCCDRFGDLSFFYDQNALWNRNLNGKLGI